MEQVGNHAKVVAETFEQKRSGRDTTAWCAASKAVAESLSQNKWISY
jgi:hypothetical protein